MRTHRAKVRISADHELRLKLPSDFPAGEAEVIVLESRDGQGRVPGRKLTVDDLLGGRLAPPPGVAPVTLADMERAIASGAAGRGGV